MPIYEYCCRDCGAKFEVLRPKRGLDDPPPCKRCQGTRTARAISRFAAHSGGHTLAGGGGSCDGCTPSGACATCSR